MSVNDRLPLFHRKRSVSKVLRYDCQKVRLSYDKVLMNINDQMTTEKEHISSDRLVYQWTLVLAVSISFC